MSKSVVGRMYNKQLVRLESGQLAIAVDIDILNEEAFVSTGGFSLSYKRRHYSINPAKQADVEILFNPRVFSNEQFEPLVQLSTNELQIDVVELVQKAFDAVAILILKFIGLGVATGFFGKIGSDVYDALKLRLQNIAERRMVESDKDTVFQIHFPSSLNNRSFLVLIQFSREQFATINSGDVSIESAMEYLSSVVGNSQIQRVTISITNDSPYWKIVSFVDVEGDTITL
jgi:hypothetical protein